MSSYVRLENDNEAAVVDMEVVGVSKQAMAGPHSKLHSLIALGMEIGACRIGAS